MSTYNELVCRLRKHIKKSICITLDEPSPMPQNAQLISHFGGMPYFEKGGSGWPCSQDGTPLDFVFQVFSTDEVKLPFGFALIQFFYSFAESPWNEDSDGWTVKVFDEIDADNLVEIPKPKGLRDSEFCAITLKTKDTLPDWEGTTIWCSDLAELSCQLNPDEPWSNYMKAAAQITGSTDFGSQICGYPQWVQGNETPFGQNGEPMELLFQIDSEDNADLMWGDMGLIYVFYDQNSDSVEFMLQSH